MADHAVHGKKLAGALPPGRHWWQHLTFGFLANWSPMSPATWNREQPATEMSEEEMVKLAGESPIRWGMQLKRQADLDGACRRRRVAAHMRYMVYVHSKLMIVDDRYMILGSANLNERSLAGNRDTEIVCGIWPAAKVESDRKHAAEDIKKLRLDRWTEHLGAVPAGADKPESSACVAAVQKIADANYRNFRTMAGPRVGFLCRLPMVLSPQSQLRVDSPVPLNATEREKLLPDAVRDEPSWTWQSGWDALFDMNGDDATE